MAERNANGPFVDFSDFCRRVDPMVLNKRTGDSLAKAGAFDSLDHPRQGLCLVFEDIVDRTLERRREEQAREDAARTAAYARHLDQLATRTEEAWREAAALIETRQPGD